ncbi:hypothetical protein AK812_SmicGene34853 [Symbiodinium microadriaticum]|uniref:Uncharacterized protein n=1 Tax=Symbiodinium microadriaticum TaxID=2951 RepID=A0A1Q9CN00_SYMMI|nr:hypothetical protein AK812_SmicGene34853 [Symbiodinium microadriaticum]
MSEPGASLPNAAAAVTDPRIMEALLRAKAIETARMNAIKETKANRTKVDKGEANNANSKKPTILDDMDPKDPLLDSLQAIFGYTTCQCKPEKMVEIETALSPRRPTPDRALASLPAALAVPGDTKARPLLKDEDKDTKSPLQTPTTANIQTSVCTKPKAKAKATAGVPNLEPDEVAENRRNDIFDRGDTRPRALSSWECARTIFCWVESFAGMAASAFRKDVKSDFGRLRADHADSRKSVVVLNEGKMSEMRGPSGPLGHLECSWRGGPPPPVGAAYTAGISSLGRRSCWDELELKRVLN